VLLTRKTGTVHNPVIYNDVQIYSGKDFALLNKSIDSQGINITGYHELRVVHDPVLQRENEAEAERLAAAKEAAKIAAEKTKAERVKTKT